MTTRRLTKAAIARALEALVEAGLPVGAVEIAPDGTLRILASPPPADKAAAGRGNSCDGRWGAAKRAGGK
jgi:hypothetical protein